MNQPRPQNFEQLIRSMRREIELLRLTQHPAIVEAATCQAGWGAKGGPTAYVSAYTVSWDHGVDGGGVVDAHSDGNAILIGAPGTYEIVAAQRVSSTTSTYIGLALNGSRLAFEARDGDVGVWSHDHASAAYEYSWSRYIGAMYVGDRVTSGPQSSAEALVYNASGHTGFLQVRRLGPLRAA